MTTIYAERAWRAFDRITLADEIGTDPYWDQAVFRSDCGTGCCYAGHLALDNGGAWLVNIRDNGDMFIDGTLVSDDDPGLEFAIWEYMLAEPDDPEDAIEETHGKQVVHVSYRAERLIGLANVSHDLFYSNNTRADLERLITRYIGPRPSNVGGNAN
ncbi:hypothetical protein [Nonomuraea sp. SYSU D8015]|uniref:hypothetical protein n=1 Tax=Nonomuraea sp. SYSU D8015 TaxID=2593644 RepID=UPI0016608732|nr:hypothetical protein [Nonomuraea sp. SYSU D8015]